MVRPSRSGGWSFSPGTAAAISSSCRRSSTRYSSGGRPRTRSVNSPSCTRTRRPCSSATVTSCAADSPVFTRTASAPSSIAATIASIRPWWLRQSTPTRSPVRTPRWDRSDRASRSERSSSSWYVMVAPRSSTTATRPGSRAAAWRSSPARLQPHRRSAFSCETTRIGRPGVSSPRRVSVAAMNGRSKAQLLRVRGSSTRLRTVCRPVRRDLVPDRGSGRPGSGGPARDGTRRRHGSGRSLRCERREVSGGAGRCRGTRCGRRSTGSVAGAVPGRCQLLRRTRRCRWTRWCPSLRRWTGRRARRSAWPGSIRASR